jgi:hypothetical protein
MRYELLEAMGTAEEVRRAFMQQCGGRCGWVQIHAADRVKDQLKIIAEGGMLSFPGSHKFSLPMGTKPTSSFKDTWEIEVDMIIADTTRVP